MGNQEKAKNEISFDGYCTDKEANIKTISDYIKKKNINTIKQT